MASPLNTFKTITKVVTSSETTVYTSPSGITTIVLLAQAANISSNVADITLIYYEDSTSTSTELVKNFSIPNNDAAALLTGKMVIETGNSLKCSASANDSFKLTLSILETLNA
jgi:hypothetical protein